MEQKMNFKQNKKYNVKAITIVLLFGGFISLFNETILNVALSRLMVEMNVTATTVQWLATGYMLIVGILVPITAFLMQTFTTKQLYLSAMILFLVGSIFAAFSTSFELLLISRMIQGIGTGMLAPLMMNTVIEINPPEKRGSAMGLCLCAALFGPAMGPTVSGIILQFFSWHALFFMLIPFAIIAIIIGAIYLENVSELTKPKMDYLSILLSTIGFAGIIYGISSIGDIQGNKLVIIISFVVGVIALIFFSKRQLSLKQPMLELRAFKYPLFSIGAVLVMITMMIVFSMNMMLPMFLQGALKTTSFIAAITLLPAVLLNGFMTPITGKIYDKIGGKVLVPAGYAIMCVFLGLLAYNLSSTIPLFVIIILYCFVCLGVSMTMAPGQTNSLNQLPKEYYPHGVAILTTLQQIAAAIGSSLFTGVMSAGQTNYLNKVSDPDSAFQQVAGMVVGFKYSVLVALIIVIIAFVLSLFLKGNIKKNDYNKEAANI